MTHGSRSLSTPRTLISYSIIRIVLIQCSYFSSCLILLHCTLHGCRRNKGALCSRIHRNEVGTYHLWTDLTSTHLRTVLFQVPESHSGHSIAKHSKNISVTSHIVARHSNALHCCSALCCIALVGNTSYTARSHATSQHRILRHIAVHDATQPLHTPSQRNAVRTQRSITRTTQYTTTFVHRTAPQNDATRCSATANSHITTTTQSLHAAPHCYVMRRAQHSANATQHNNDTSVQRLTVWLVAFLTLL